MTYEPNGLSETSFHLHPTAEEVAQSMRGEEGECRELTMTTVSHKYVNMDDPRSMQCGSPQKLEFITCEAAFLIRSEVTYLERAFLSKDHG